MKAEKIEILKNLYRSVTSSSKLKTALKVVAVLCLSGLATRVFAAGGQDLLKGTEAALVGTLQGTGKTYLYIAECVVSLLAYIQTKNIMVLIGIIVVAVFFNIMLTLTGVAG